MDDFTPPPPDEIPRPPIPPPPTDLPDDYHAFLFRRPSTGTSTISNQTSSRQTLREESGVAVATGAPAEIGSTTNGRQRRGSLGSFLSRSRSRTREIPVVTTADGHTKMRKQKLQAYQERLRGERETHDTQARVKQQQQQLRSPPSPPSPPPIPVSASEESVTVIYNKTSNFSRPYHSTMPTTSTISMPVLGQTPPLQQQASPSLAQFDRPADGSMDMAPPKPQYAIAATTGINNYYSPRRVRRRKDPTPFNILVIGAKGSGKSNFIDFLKHALALPAEKVQTPTPKISTTSDGAFTSHHIECEFDGERTALTLWDSQGLEKNLVDLQVREIVRFIESKFEETFTEESKIMRSASAKDTHIHCVFLVLDPNHLDTQLRANRIRHKGNGFAQSRPTPCLDPVMDLQVLKILFGKTTVIPIISKADIMTGAHLNYLKRSVWSAIQAEKLDPLEALAIDDEEEEDDDSQYPSDEETMPVSKTTNGKLSPLDNDSDSSDGPSDTSPAAKTRSSATTPSPGQPLRRPASRILSRCMAPGEEEIYIPFTLLSPDPYDEFVIGRRFPWGTADPYNSDHCDYIRLRDSVFSEWREELVTASREKWYESWRTNRLAHNEARMRHQGGVTSAGTVPRGMSPGERAASPRVYQRSASGGEGLSPSATKYGAPIAVRTSPTAF